MHDEGKQEEKFEFTAEGLVFACISLDYPRLAAMLKRALILQTWLRFVYGEPLASARCCPGRPFDIHQVAFA